MPFERLAFDPSAGSIVREPPGAGYGYWAGGHKVTWDPEVGFVLFYRLRTPLERGRGGLCRVAVSRDGRAFEDVWEASKEDLAAGSIEVGHAVRHDEAGWRLYLSYERAGQPGYWRIDVLEGPSPDRFDTQGRRTVLDPGNFSVDFIKDPFVVRRPDGGYRLYATVNPRKGPRVDGQTVTTGPQEETVLAESDDGHYFETIEYVLAPPGARSWHGQRARLNGYIELEGSLVGSFDGSRTVYDNYEERCGLVTSTDGRRFHRVVDSGPWIDGIRDAFPLRVEDRVHWYYEFTRPDGSHDLRTSVVQL
jgi:hypothetical protein